jgi:hypothetical protein
VIGSSVRWWAILWGASRLLAHGQVGARQQASTSRNSNIRIICICFCVCVCVCVCVLLLLLQLYSARHCQHGAWWLQKSLGYSVLVGVYNICTLICIVFGCHFISFGSCRYMSDVQLGGETNFPSATGTCSQLSQM